MKLSPKVAAISLAFAAAATAAGEPMGAAMEELWRVADAERDSVATESRLSSSSAFAAASADCSIAASSPRIAALTFSRTLNSTCQSGMGMYGEHGDEKNGGSRPATYLFANASACLLTHGRQMVCTMVQPHRDDVKGSRVSVVQKSQFIFFRAHFSL